MQPTQHALPRMRMVILHEIFGDARRPIALALPCLSEEPAIVIKTRNQVMGFSDKQVSAATIEGCPLRSSEVGGRSKPISSSGILDGELQRPDFIGKLNGTASIAPSIEAVV
jgi:hypothetical protein